MAKFIDFVKPSDRILDRQELKGLTLNRIMFDFGVVVILITMFVLVVTR